MTSGALYQVVCIQTPGWTADTLTCRGKVNLFRWLLLAAHNHYIVRFEVRMYNSHGPQLGEDCGQLIYNWMQLCHWKTLVVFSPPSKHMGFDPVLRLIWSLSKKKLFHLTMLQVSGSRFFSLACWTFSVFFVDLNGHSLVCFSVVGTKTKLGLQEESTYLVCSLWIFFSTSVYNIIERESHTDNTVIHCSFKLWVLRVLLKNKTNFSCKRP